MLVVALVGIVITTTLLTAYVTQAALPYCGAASACDVVQQSRWSVFLGVPLSAWGLLAYLALALAVMFDRGRAPSTRLIVFLASFGFVLSLYLTAVSAFVIKAMCIYCLASLALWTLAFALGFRGASAVTLGARRWQGGVAAAVFALLMHVMAGGFGGTAVVDPGLKALAEHLEATGAQFYGASWCPHCQQQKDLFGGAADYLPYVECSPHGPKAPRATTCELKQINNYPTWMINERRMERVIPVEMLAKLSGFQGELPRNQAAGVAH